jgi:hypothetical protein
MMKKRILSNFLASFKLSYLARIAILLTTLTFLISCKGAGDGFAALEEVFSDQDEAAEIEFEEESVEIISYSPTASPVRVADNLETTFVVSVNPTAGSSLTYAWKLNGSLLSSQTNPFLQVNGSIANAGVNSLEVIATNSVNSASKIFTLYKNTAPAIDTTTPGFTGNNVTCGGSNAITFTTTHSDVDGDNLSPTWKLNGVPSHSSFNTTSTASSSSTVFSPPCSMTGPNIVSVEIDDGYQSTTASWSVTIVNPLVAQIVGFTPLVAPIVIQENDTQNFTVSASGSAPFDYSWAINSDPGVSSGAVPSYAAAASSFTQPDGVTELGVNTFTVTVTDDNSSTDSHVFSVKINSIPTISNPVPPETDLKMNINSTRVFSIATSDLNNDALIYTWQLNGGAAPTGIFTGSGASITFNPSSNQLGDNTIKVIVDDGFSNLEISRIWNVNVNHFSEECNALEAGEVCTLVGPAGLGSSINPINQPQVAKIRPYEIVNDGNDNYFVLDTAQDVVWFYNQSSSPITVIGSTVNAGELSVVAGVGAYGVGTAGAEATKYRMAEPTGIAWDSDRGDLYVALRYANKIVRFTSSGSSQHVLCSGSGGNTEIHHADGGPATGHACYRPTGLGIYHNGATKRLYVANYDHDNIKYFDISSADTNNWTGHILICDKASNGKCQPGSTNGSIGDDSVARVNNPWGLHVDTNGLVHWSEIGGCRIGVANPTTTSYSFYGGAVSLPPNTAQRVGGSGSCTTYGANSAHKTWNTQRIRHPYSIMPYHNGSTYYGWFVTNYDHDVVTFFNTHTTALTIGNRLVDPGKSHFVFGVRAVDGYNGDAQEGKSTLLWTPFGLAMNAAKTHLIVGERDNYRIRTLDISVTNGAVTSMVAGKEKADFSGGSNTPAPNALMNTPEGISFDAVNNSMLFTDRSNCRVRNINLSTGLENVIIGAGCGNGDSNAEDPSDTYLRYAKDVLIHNNGVIYLEQYGSSGANRNVQVRAFNRNSVATDFFGTTVPAGKVSTIAGSFVIGSHSTNNTIWGAAYEGQPATSSAFRTPNSMATDGTNLYITDYNNYCVMKVDPSGVLTTFAGVCGNNTYGYVNGTPYDASTIKFRNPTQIEHDPEFPGGFFVVDQTYTNNSRIRYINSTSSPVTIADQTISANSVATVFDTQRGWGVAAFENWICYTSGHSSRADLGNHNIVCKDRTDVFGITQFRIGPSGSSDKGAIQFAREEEGIVAPGAHFYAPGNLTFDNEGNLYITELSAHVIRFVKRWW